MIHKMLIVTLASAVLAVSMTANAQGRPSNAGQKPAAAQQHELVSMREAAEARRLEADARRLQADSLKAEAELKRAAAEANNRSAIMRSDHPPDAHAAPEAFDAELNAAHADVRELRPDLQGANSGDRGGDDAEDGDGD